MSNHDDTLRPGEMYVMTSGTDKHPEEFDWQLLRKIETGDPDYAIEHLTAKGVENLNRLASAGYVRIDGQVVTVTTSGLAALMPHYAFGYACELTSLREYVADLTTRLDAWEAGK